MAFIHFTQSHKRFGRELEASLMSLSCGVDLSFARLIVRNSSSCEKINYVSQTINARNSKISHFMPNNLEKIVKFRKVPPHSLGPGLAEIIYRISNILECCLALVCARASRWSLRAETHKNLKLKKKNSDHQKIVFRVNLFDCWPQSATHTKHNSVNFVKYLKNCHLQEPAKIGRRWSLRARNCDDFDFEFLGHSTTLSSSSLEAAASPLRDLI